MTALQPDYFERPLAATGPDGRLYVAWTHRPRGRAHRAAVLRRVL